ncbi:MAG: hypothetical protein WAW39_00845 [Prosthecobacter sp.]|uniref:hypothetical protein n=1 Tax=Prosthecobacter sp. TaxID=1965333 RepID=UPI003BB0F44D
MKLTTEIIRILREAEGHPLLLSVVRAQIDARVRPRPMKGLVDDAIETLMQKSYILQTPNEMDDADPFYLLDERGAAYAAQQRL